MKTQAPQEIRSDVLLRHWHPPSQTMASFAPGWHSPRGSLKSSSGSAAGTVTEEVGIVTGQADTREELETNLQEAVEGWLSAGEAGMHSTPDEIFELAV